MPSSATGRSAAAALVLALLMPPAIQVPLQAQESSEADAAFMLKAQRLESIVFRRPRLGTAFDLLIQHYQDAGREQQLVRRVQDRVAKTPDDPRVHLTWGLISQRLRQNESAVKAFERARELAADDYYPRMLLAEELLRAQDTERAVAELSQAIKLNVPRQDYLQMAKQLAQLHQRVGDGQRAQEIWGEISQRFSSDVRVLTELANLLQNETQFDAALQLWQSVQEQTRDEPFQQFDARLHIAQIHLQTGKHEQAVAELGSLLDEVKPESWRADNVRRLIQQALLDQAGPEALVTFWSERLKRNADELSAMIQLARALSRVNRDQQAEQQYRKALTRAPKQRELHDGLIAIYIRRGDFASAISQAEELAEMFPNDADVHWQLGQLYLQNGNEDEPRAQQQAIGAWKKMADIQPDDAAAAVRVAEACRTAASPRSADNRTASSPQFDAHSFDARKFDPHKLPPVIREQETLLLDTAEDYYREAIRRDPNAEEYHEYLGEFLHWLDRPDEAVSAWMEMARSDLPTAWNDVSRVLIRFGYLDPAIAAADKAVKAEPKNVEYRQRYIDLLSQAGRHQQARDALASWPASDSERWEEMAAELRVDIAVEARVVDDEIRRLRDLVAAKQDDYLSHWTLAMLLAASGQPVEAARAMNDAVELRPDDARLRRRLANLLEAANRPELAAAQYRRLVRLQPERRRDDYQRIVDLELRQNRLAEAALAAQKLVQAAPTDPESHLLKATVAMRQGDAKGRIAALRRAVQVAPRDLQVRRQLATALRDGGQSQPALTEAYQCLALAESLSEKRSILSWILDWTSGLPERRWLLQRVQQDRQQQSDTYALTLSLVLLLERMNRVDDAMDELSRLQIQHPSDVGILADLVRLAEATNNLSLAVKYQEQRVRIDQTPNVMEHLARLYRQAGRLEDAAGIWDELLDKTVAHHQAVATVDRLLEQGDLFQAQRFAEAGLARFSDSWQLAYRSGLIHMAMSQPAAARSALSAVVLAPVPPQARNSSTAIPAVYQELLSALKAGEQFRTIKQRVEQHGARNPRTLSLFFDSNILKAGGTASLDATRIYSAVAALTLAYESDEAVDWLKVDGDSSSQRRLALIASWVTHRALDCRRLIAQTRQDSPAEPLPHLLTLLNPPHWDSDTPHAPIAELQFSFDWLVQHQPRMGIDGLPLYVSRLFYHPDRQQVRQLTAQWIDDAADFSSLPPIIPLVRLVNEPELSGRFLRRVAELFPDETGEVVAENDLQSAVRSAIDLSDWSDDQQVQLVVRLFDALLARSQLTTLSRRPIAFTSGSDPYGKLVQQINKDTTALMSRRSELRRRRQLPPRQAQRVQRLAWVPHQQEVVHSAIAGVFAIGGQIYYSSPPPVSNQRASKETVWFPVPTTELDHTRLERLESITRKMVEVDRAGQWLEHLRKSSTDESVDQRSFQLADVIAIWMTGRQREAIERLTHLSTHEEDPRDLPLLLVQAHLQRNDLPAALRSLNAISTMSESAQQLRRAIANQWGRHALIATLEGHTGTVTSVAFSPDGKWLASCGVDRTVRVWNAETLELRETITDHQDIVLSVSFSPRADRLVSVGYDRVVRLWNMDDLKQVAALEAHESAVRAAVFSPDGQRLATGGDDRMIVVWDVSTGQQLAKLQGHVAPITSLSFNRSGTAIASASADGTIRLWPIDSETRGHTIESNEGAVRTALYLNSDDRLATGYDASAFSIWRRTEQTWSANRHAVEAAVRSIAYDEKRNRIAIGLDDHALHLRDADTGSEQQILRGHTARVVTVAFAPGGEQLASAGFDGTIKLWSTATPSE